MGQRCTGTSGEHADAMRLVEYLDAHGGVYEGPNDELTRKLDWLKKEGRGFYVDNKRYNRARQHVMEREDKDGNPCCLWRINYKHSGKHAYLALIDPSGDLGEHIKAVIATIAGHVQRSRQWRVEESRVTEQYRAAADHALARGDLDCARLMLQAHTDMRRDGMLSAETTVELEAWLAANGVSA